MPPSAVATADLPLERVSVSPPAPRARAVRAKPNRTRLWVAALGLAAVLGGGGLWWSGRGIESTDNAQVDADVIAVPARIGGTVARVFFEENQQVKAGALLAQLDDAPARAKLAQAEANLAAARASAEAAAADALLVGSNAEGNRAMAAASLQTSSVGARASADEIREGEAQVATAEARRVQADTDLTRAKALFAAGAYPRSSLDQAETAYQVANTNLLAQRARLATLTLSQSQSQSRVVEASAKLRLNSQIPTLVRQAQAKADAARAQVDTAAAARDLAALELSYTRILAPHAGVVSKKSINEGQTVGMGQTVVQLVPAERWITANFKETQLSAMRVGQPVSFHVDAYPDVTIQGEVESFSGATGSRFTLLPPDNATGNYTKVVQRLPVRIRLRDVPRGVALRPGLSVELSVDTRQRS